MIQAVANIFEKIEARERLSEQDALTLFEHADLLDLGRAAERVNALKNGSSAFYNINRHINPTNVCAMSCKFCAYSKKPGEEGSYTYTIEEILERAEAVVKQGATEVHMVGGLHPRWRLKNYLEIVSAVHNKFPNLHIKAFTAVELDWMARRERMTIKEVLLALRDVGLGSLPGGGAEIFHPEVREQICDTKTDADKWIEVHRTAHELGMRSNCTMLYGHIESYAHRVDHMARLRALQDETKGFNCFIPLAFQPHDNYMGISRYTFGEDDLRTLAIARLFLDNFNNIKAYWIMLGQDFAQIGLNFGANDIDGTVTEEKISKAAGGRAGVQMARNEIESIITKAGRTPQERDTLYRPINIKESNNQRSHVASEENILLYKASRGFQLTTDELKTVVAESSLHDLGQCAHALAQKGEGEKTMVQTARMVPLYGEHALPAEHGNDAAWSVNENTNNNTLVVDLDDTQFPAVEANELLDTIVARLDVLREAYQARQLVIRGMKPLLRISYTTNLSFETMFARLALSGVRRIEPSPNESHEDLTMSELRDLHKSAHGHDIRTVAVVELATRMEGSLQLPHWIEFLRRLCEFEMLNQSSHGIAALQIRAAPDCFVTPVEFLQAVALARLSAQSVEIIECPFNQIPSIRTSGKCSTISQSPRLKLLPLLRRFGVQSFGWFDPAQDNLQPIFAELSGRYVAAAIPLTKKMNSESSDESAQSI
jgi:aminodeoxyfutalosine synthase